MRKTRFSCWNRARLCYNRLGELERQSVLAGPLTQQSAYTACAAAEGDACPASELLPVYLRLSQAEQERQARLSQR